MPSYLIRRTIGYGCPICNGTTEDVMDVGVKFGDGTILEARACWACIRKRWSEKEWLERIPLERTGS